MFIELFLLVAVAGSRSRHFPKTVLTIVGLSGATIVYVEWWHVVFQTASNAGVSIDAITHFAYLSHGNPLDLAIALSIAALIVLNVRYAADSLIHGTT